MLKETCPADDRGMLGAVQMGLKTPTPLLSESRLTVQRVMETLPRRHA